MVLMVKASESSTTSVSEGPTPAIYQTAVCYS